jgi:hypothetical protein
MKTFFVLLTSLLSLVSCVKYSQPKLLSLNGEYRIDKVTYEKVDNSDTTDYMVFYPGDLYVNPNDISPFDTIAVGFFKLHMDYSMIRFSPNELPDGSTQWGKEYFYDVVGDTYTNLGNLIIEFEGTRKVFNIIEDGAETLVLRSTGQWANGSAGANESITLFLTRVGP